MPVSVHGHTETVKLLLDLIELLTPLFDAAAGGNPETVLEYGAIYLTMIETPLCEAVMKGHTEIVKILFDHLKRPFFY